MTRILTLMIAALALAAAPVDAGAQTAGSACVAGGRRCITVSFHGTEMREVAAVFAEFAGQSVVLAPDVAGQVTAEVRNQPWDVAFAAILEAYGYAAREIAPGMLRSDSLERLARNAVQAPLVTRVFRINYVPAADVAKALEGVVSDRGHIAVSEATNALVVTDTEEVIATMARIIGHPPV
jgi:type II secretory pathway component HofQ